MTDLNNNHWPQIWVDTYVNLTARIEATRQEETREALRNERHRFYVLCMTVLAEG